MDTGLEPGGERYVPVRERVAAVKTIWEPRDAARSAESKGVKIAELLTKRDWTGDPHTMVLDLHCGEHEALAVVRANPRVTLLGKDDAALDFFATALLEDAPAPPPPPMIASNAIIVNFSYNTSLGNSGVSRIIAAPKWEDIKNNYPEKVRGRLDDFITGGPDDLRSASARAGSRAAGRYTRTSIAGQPRIALTPARASAISASPCQVRRAALGSRM